MGDDLGTALGAPRLRCSTLFLGMRSNFSFCHAKLYLRPRSDFVAPRRSRLDLLTNISKPPPRVQPLHESTRLAKQRGARADAGCAIAAMLGVVASPGKAA